MSEIGRLRSVRRRIDKDPRWTLPELHAEAADIDPSLLADALGCLDHIWTPAEIIELSN